MENTNIPEKPLAPNDANDTEEKLNENVEHTDTDLIEDTSTVLDIDNQEVDSDVDVQEVVSDVDDPEVALEIEAPPTDNADVQSTPTPLFQSADEIKQEMAQLTMGNLTGFQFLSGNQEPIDTRSFGEMGIHILEIENIHTSQFRTRLELGDIEALRESIRKYGQLVPILVTQLEGNYVLVQGFRRLEALKGLGQTQVLAVVDTTIPPELVKYYEVIANASKPYTFTEQLNYGNFFKETQPTIGYETIENALGLGAGEFLKALYIQYHREQYPQFYDSVETGKMTIAQAMKKLEKEIEKAEKEATAGADALNSGEMDDELRSKDELALTTPNSDAGKQDVGDRKVLDPVLRRSIEARDEGTCQCCGFGKGEPDFMGVFQVHHIIPVMYGGSDNKGNLILLCTNCHKLVHDYEVGRFLPESETWQKHISVKKIVVLGNMLQKLRGQALKELKRNHVEIYRTVNMGKLGLGKGIAKAKLNLNGEEVYGGSPYGTFKDVTKDLVFGGMVQGDLGRLNTLSDEDDLEETPDVEAMETENQTVSVETGDSPTEVVEERVSE